MISKMNIKYKIKV